MLHENTIFLLTTLFYQIQGTPKRQGYLNSGSNDSGINSTVGPGAMMSMSVDVPNHHHEELYQQQLLPVSDNHGVIDNEIPEDPLLAETHYSQFEDFEADESSYSESEDDDYEAFLGCIEEALELPNQPGNVWENSHTHTHTHIM